MGELATLGDVGPRDDVSYTGDVSTSPVSLDYFRSKVTEFQSTLQGLDAGYQAALLALDQGAGALSDDDYAALQDSVSEFQSKRWTLKATAEAINAGAAVVNAAGGRMPKLSIPGTLGLLPAIPIAAIAAVGTAAALTIWGNTWLRGLNERLKAAQLIETATTPEARAAIATAIIKSDEAIAVADAGGFSAIAPLLKWGAIALGAWMVWKALQKRGS